MMHFYILPFVRAIPSSDEMDNIDLLFPNSLLWLGLVVGLCFLE